MNASKREPEKWYQGAGRSFHPIAVFIMVVIGSALATLSKGAEPELALAPADPTSGQPEPIAPQSTGIWQGEVGEGFRSGVHTVSLEVGVAPGLRTLGSRQAHSLVLTSLGYGRMVFGVMGEDHWYRGNWELRGEFFGGGQYSPSSDWLFGLTPHLRYNFATGTRWIPFVDGGAGVAATGIGHPDLSGTFEFNEQANIGMHYFMRGNAALTFETGYMHVSDCCIHEPNQGLNCLREMFGVTWFF